MSPTGGRLDGLDKNRQRKRQNQYDYKIPCELGTLLTTVTQMEIIFQLHLQPYKNFMS